MASVTYDLTNKKVWVAGHRGMVGSALVRRLQSEEVLVQTASRAELDLQHQPAVNDWMSINKPDVIILAAAKVGGIQANNQHPVDFLQSNLQIQTNVMSAAGALGIERLLFLGSSCIYPKLAEQPIREESLLTNSLEPTNECYAIAKIAGLKLVQAYRRQQELDWISAMPTNLYGPGDNYDLEGSHVLPALLRRIHEAKIKGEHEVTIWGSGAPLREFMHSDDLADALVFLLKNYSGDEAINVGSGQEVSIINLAKLISLVIGFEGSIATDISKPDGSPRKLLDCSRLSVLGWSGSRILEQGIRDAYASFKEEYGAQ